MCEHILVAFERVNWDYALHDELNVLQQFQERICEVAGQKKTISYADLVAGIEFQFNNFNDGNPFQIHNFRNSAHRRLVGDLLDYLNFISYQQGCFMASSLVVTQETGRPGKGFFEMMRRVGAIPNLHEDVKEKFWIESVQKTFAWYGNNPQGFQIRQ